MPPAAPKVFLSFANRDEPFVRRLRAALTERVPGIQFFSGHQITPGDEWADMLTRMIESSEVVLVVVSANATSNSWSGFELGFALRSSKRIIPVLRDSPSKISPVLRPLAYLDFREDRKFYELVGTLASAILNRPEPQAGDGEIKETGRRYVEAQEEQLLLLQEHQTKVSRALLQEDVRRSLAGFILVVMSALVLAFTLAVFFHKTDALHEAGIFLTPITGILSAVVGYYFGQRSTVGSSDNKSGAGPDI